MVLADAVALITAFALSGGDALVLSLGAIILLPAALSGLGGAAISTISGVPPPFRESDLFLPPEIASLRLYLRTLTPIVVATIGALPVVLAAQRVGRHGGVSLSTTLASATSVEVLVIVAGVVVWVLVRDRVHRVFASVSQQAGRRSGSE
jgi:hypothetical protein